MYPGVVRKIHKILRIIPCVVSISWKFHLFFSNVADRQAAAPTSRSQLCLVPYTDRDYLGKIEKTLNLSWQSLLTIHLYVWVFMQSTNIYHTLYWHIKTLVRNQSASQHGYLNFHLGNISIIQLCVIYTWHVANTKLSTLHHLASSVSLPCFFQHLFSKTLCTCTLSQRKSASPAYHSTIELPLWICLHNMYLDILEAQTILTACYLLCLTFLTTF